MHAYIIYGFGEGSWHGRKFVEALNVRGISMTDDLQQANYVIAHSGGCFYVPPLRDNQLLMLIGAPYWPGRTLASRGGIMIMQMLAAMRPGNRPLYRFYNNFRHLVSLFASGRSNWRIARRAKTFQLEKEATHTNTIVVRNEHDPWITSELEALQKINPHLSLVSLPGTHLHCWEFPDMYIDLLEQYKVI